MRYCSSSCEDYEKGKNKACFKRIVMTGVIAHALTYILKPASTTRNLNTKTINKC